MFNRNPSPWIRSLRKINSLASGLSTAVSDWIVRWMPLGLPVGLVAAIVVGSLYVVGVFFDTEPAPLEIKITRSCAGDVSPPLIYILLPANVVYIYTHGEQKPNSPDSGRCSTAAICATNGKLTTGGMFGMDTEFKPDPENRSCWKIATKTAALPNQEGKNKYNMVAGDDVNDLTLKADFGNRISFSRRAISLHVDLLSQEVNTSGEHYIPAVKPDVNVTSIIFGGYTIVSSMPAATRQFHLSINPRPDEIGEIFSFGDTLLPAEISGNGDAHSLYLIYESDKEAAAREFLLFLLAALLGASLQSVVDSWKEVRKQPPK
jgi:hypothetical protein